MKKEANRKTNPKKFNSAEKTELNQSLKLIAKSSIIILIFLIFSKLTTYIYRIIIARYFGPEVYGLFSLSIMIVGWFIAIFSIGLVEGIIRFVSNYRGEKNQDKINHVIKVSINFLIFTSFASAIILFLLSRVISINIFHNSNLIIFLKWFSLSIPLYIFASLFISIIQAHERIDWYSFIRYVLDGSVKLITITIFLLLGLKINALFISYLLGILGMLLLSFYLCKYKLKGLFKKSKLNTKQKIIITKELLSYSWPLVFVGLVAFLFVWIDSFVIGYLKNATQVGIYNSAVPIAALFVIAPSLFIQLFFTLINKEFAKKEISIIKEMSKQTVKWIFILNLPFLILMLLFPEAFINLLFGQEYLSASNALRFLSIGMFFYSIFIVSENLISMSGKSKIVLLNISIAATLNLILNIILVPKYGITGAGFSTMLTYIIWSFLSLIQAKKITTIIPLRRKMLTILLISIIPTLILIKIKNYLPTTILSVIIQITLFLLLYVLLIFITKSLDKNDLMIIYTIKKKFSKEIS